MTNTILVKKTFWFYLSIAFLFCMIYPIQTNAQAYVPTIDQVLKTEFPSYHTHFGRAPQTGTYWGDFWDLVYRNKDSLAQLLSGMNPRGIARQGCIALEEPNTHDPHYTLENSGLQAPDGTPQGLSETVLYVVEDPEFVGAPLVNTSGSLRCIMQELVEWKKMELNLTIHSMTKEHISDALGYQLAKSLLNVISAAKMEWSKDGIQYVIGANNEGPVILKTSAPVSNYTAVEATNEGLLRSRLIAQIRNKEVTVPKVYEDILLKMLMLDTIEVGQKEIDLAAHKMYGNFPFEDDVESYKKWLRTPTSAPNWQNTFLIMLEPQNNPVSGSGIAKKIIWTQSEELGEELRIQTTGEPVFPITECADGDSDPYCIEKKVKTPSFGVRASIKEATGGGDRNMRLADEKGEQSSISSQNLSLNLLLKNQGLLEYDTKAFLDNSDNRFWDSYEEFVTTIQHYYGVNQDTRDWINQTVVNTWDTVTRKSKMEPMFRNLDSLLLEAKKLQDHTN